ncbi:MAG: anaerobic ribonucleoside-triphosphate reductase activating protein [Candidatus Moranbacteria bacterium]|nr:anaerobic ribonucleoside-triphosphate reductase activating protein [Candidatus Moranbacteria bacterium]
MKLGGLQKLTLIDYPGKIAATVFTVGCSFRCPFCHNPELVLPDWSGGTGSVSEKEFFDFLKSRKNKLEGVCITGGEPTIQKNLLEFMGKIKELNFAVKLDSNGTRPDVLREAFEKKLVDFVSMDIKNAPEKYSQTAGVEADLERIKLSVKLIQNSRINYEFRTTVVPGFHEENDFDKIAQWLKGSKKYALQKFRDEGKLLDGSIRKDIDKHQEVDLEKVKKKVEKYFGEVEVR